MVGLESTPTAKIGSNSLKGIARKTTSLEKTN
jgi:hypothetical protein